MGIDLFSDLKQLDDRIQKAAGLLDSASDLLQRYYSENEEFPNVLDSFTWPYSISATKSGPEWPDYSKKFTEKPHMSVITSAMCGWAMSKYLAPNSKSTKQLREISLAVAGAMATLPPVRLESQTFVGKNAVFVSAQVLRFLAGHAKFSGALFDKALDDVCEAIKSAPSADEKPHPFLLYYCVLALEQIREPIRKLAREIRQIQELSVRLKKFNSSSWAKIVELTELGNQLQDHVEALSTVVGTDLLQFDLSKHLDTQSSNIKEPLNKLSQAILKNDSKIGDASLIQFRGILNACVQHASEALKRLPSKIVGSSLFHKTWEELGTIAKSFEAKDWYANLSTLLRDEVLSQISYASSGAHSQFDAGALSYSLAAALKVGAIDLTSPMTKKALSVILEHQSGGRWMDIQPLGGSPQGTVHFPLNIEIPNALLPVLALLADSEMWSSWTEIDTVFDWVYATSTKVRTHRGWCSDHAYSPNRIDLFVTAQIAQFLSEYIELRRRLVVQSAFAKASLVPVRAEAVGTHWEDLQPTDLGKPLEQQLKSTLKSSFVLRYQRDRKLRESSVLLYGPPGTSKTSLMEALANKLAWRFLSISPADFLSAGGEQIEAKATLIFEILKRADNLVVLFDEVDELLFDREANVESRPQGIFRFMTTSMLPKLQSLKSRGQIVFGVATNYRERLDKAITRPGRFDQVRAVLPLDLTSRMVQILMFAERESVPSCGGYKEAKRLAIQTPFFSYRELQKVVRQQGKENGDPWEIVPHPTASPVEYASRPRTDDEFRDLLKSQITRELKSANGKMKNVVGEQLRELKDKALARKKSGDRLFEEATIRAISKAITNLSNSKKRKGRRKPRKVK